MSESNRTVETSPTYRWVYGQLPRPDMPEYREMMKYESGEADTEAAAVAGQHGEPWLNVIEACEPGALSLLRMALHHAEFCGLFRGRVVDLGAGTCWAAALVSRLDTVDEVVAVDLSERFFRHVSTRMIRLLNGRPEKIVFAVSSFDAVPCPDASCDVALLIAAIHHARAPLRVLDEARRLLRPDGTLLMIENPAALIHIRRARRDSFTLTRETGATEMAYTRGELEYLLRMGGFRVRRYVPDARMSPDFFRRNVRRLLRRTGLEDLFFGVGYMVIASPDQ